LIEGVYRLLLSSENRPVNIGNPHEISLLNFALEIIRLSNSDTKISFKPLPQDDPKQRQPDINRAKQVLKWEPKIQLAKGLLLTYNHYKKEI